MREERQAAAGLSQVRSPSRRDHSRTAALSKPAVDQREPGARLARGGLAGPVVAEVVEVHPEDDGRPLGRRHRAERLHQRGLAAGAAVGAVGHVGRVVHLVGRDAHPPQPPLAGQGPAVGLLGGGERRRDRGRPPGPASAPSVSWATLARNAESAPPLNATTTRSSEASSASSASSVRGGHTAPPGPRISSRSATMPVKKGPNSA